MLNHVAQGETMKLIMFTFLSIVPMTSFAAAQCPKGSTQILACKSTPVHGDSVVASGTFDSIGVCRSDDKAWLLVEKRGESELAEATFVDRPGGSIYTVLAKDVEFEFSPVTGLAPGTPVKAKFTITLKGAGSTRLSSTYSCDL